MSDTLRLRRLTNRRLSTQMALSSSGSFDKNVHLLRWDILSGYLPQCLLDRWFAYIVITYAGLRRRGPLGSLSDSRCRGLVIIFRLHSIWVIHRNFAYMTTAASHMIFLDCVARRRALKVDLGASADTSTELQVHLSETVVWCPSWGLIKVLLEVRMSLCEVDNIFDEEPFIPGRSLLYCVHSVIFLRRLLDGWEHGLGDYNGNRPNNSGGRNWLWHLHWLRRLCPLSCSNHTW